MSFKSRLTRGQEQYLRKLRSGSKAYGGYSQNRVVKALEKRGLVESTNLMGMNLPLATLTKKGVEFLREETLSGLLGAKRLRPPPVHKCPNCGTLIHGYRKSNGTIVYGGFDSVYCSMGCRDDHQGGHKYGVAFSG